MKLRDSFEQACLDFIQLQRLDYAAALSCEHGARRLTADGITIGFHALMAHFEKPYAALGDSRIVVGSAYKDRLFVLDHRIRAELAQYASSQNSPPPGLTAAKLEALCDTISLLPAGDTEHASLHAAAHTLLPFLEQHEAGETGMLRPPCAWRQCLHALATPAPTCQLLPLSCHPAAQQLLDSGAIEKQAWGTLLQHSPVLHKLLQDTLIGARRTVELGGVGLVPTQTLVKHLLEVRMYWHCHRYPHRWPHSPRPVMEARVYCCLTLTETTSDFKSSLSLPRSFDGYPMEFTTSVACMSILLSVAKPCI